MYGRNQHNIVKQLSSNKKINKKREKITKKKIIISIDVEKASDKIQYLHLFMIKKNFPKCEHKGNISHIIKAIEDNH